MPNSEQSRRFKLSAKAADQNKSKLAKQDSMSANTVPAGNLDLQKPVAGDLENSVGGNRAGMKASDNKDNNNSGKPAKGNLAADPEVDNPTTAAAKKEADMQYLLNHIERPNLEAFLAAGKGDIASELRILESLRWEVDAWMTNPLEGPLGLFKKKKEAELQHLLNYFDRPNLEAFLESAKGDIISELKILNSLRWEIDAWAADLMKGPLGLRKKGKSPGA